MTWRAATLAATVNPQGLATTWHLDYGRTAAYGSRTADGSLPAGSWSAQAVSAALGTLRPGTLLHYRVVGGERRRHDQRGRPHVPHGTARRSPGDDRRRQQRRGHRRRAGRVDRPLRCAHPLRLPVRADPGLRRQHRPAAARRRRRRAWPSRRQLPDLLPSTLYHYRVLAISAGGTAAGADATFVSSRTPGSRAVQTFAEDDDVPALGAPVGIAAAAPQVASTGVLPEQTRADALGFVTANGGATTVLVQYGVDTTYGSQTPAIAVGSSAAGQLVDVPLEGLSPGATLHARLVAQNALGTSYGEDEAFTLGPAGPQADTAAAHAVASRSAELDALVDAGGSATDYRFEWGASTAYGSSTTPSSAGTEAGSQAVGASLTALTPGTTYHARVVAHSARGTAYGRDVTLHHGRRRRLADHRRRGRDDAVRRAQPWRRAGHGPLRVRAHDGLRPDHA